MTKPLRSNTANDTAAKLLDAAERLFAQQSYEGTSIREITSAAGVRLALAHYHFGSKQDLFRAVLARRADIVNASRLSLLDHFRSLRGTKPLLVEQIVRSYISPYVYWCKTGGAGWRDYAILGARILSSDAWISLLSELFDDLAQTFLSELRRTFPRCDEDKIQWAFDFLVGSMASTFSQNNRIQRLSEGLCSSDELEAACSRLIPFISTGIETVISGSTVSFTEDFLVVRKHYRDNQGKSQI